MQARTRDRLRTGVRGLDEILGGGLLSGAIYALAGGSGAGKTVISNQIAYHRARQDDSTLFVTLMTESHGRMLENLEDMEFFEPALAGSRVIYISGHGSLLEGGLSGLLEMIEAEIRRRNPSLLIIDGTCAAARAGTGAEFRAFINRLRASLELRPCTGLLSLRDPRIGDDGLYSLADGVLVLSDRVVGARSVRRFTVDKYRGSSHLGGEHEFVIDRRGATFYPRIESRPISRASEGPPSSGPRGFGIAGLDRMLHGGLAPASATELLGAPGSGKTLLGLSFLCAGADQGERGLYLGLYETPQALVPHGEGIGLPLGRHRDAGRVELVWHPAAEGSVDAILGDLLQHVEERDIQRVVIDGYDGLRAASAFPERVAGALSATNHELRGRGASVLITVEGSVIGPPVIPPQPTSALVENAMALRYAEVDSQLRRLVSIIKVRGSAYDPTIRELRISEQGIEILDSFAGAEGLLGGQPHRPGGRR